MLNEDIDLNYLSLYSISYAIISKLCKFICETQFLEFSNHFTSMLVRGRISTEPSQASQGCHFCLKKCLLLYQELCLLVIYQFPWF